MTSDTVTLRLRGPALPAWRSPTASAAAARDSGGWPVFEHADPGSGDHDVLVITERTACKLLVRSATVASTNSVAHDPGDIVALVRRWMDQPNDMVLFARPDDLRWFLGVCDDRDLSRQVQVLTGLRRAPFAFVLTEVLAMRYDIGDADPDDLACWCAALDAHGPHLHQIASLLGRCMSGSTPLSPARVDLESRFVRAAWSAGHLAGNSGSRGQSMAWERQQEAVACKQAWWATDPLAAPGAAASGTAPRLIPDGDRLVVQGPCRIRTGSSIHLFDVQTGEQVGASFELVDLVMGQQRLEAQIAPEPGVDAPVWMVEKPFTLFRRNQSEWFANPGDDDGPAPVIRDVPLDVTVAAHT